MTMIKVWQNKIDSKKPTVPVTIRNYFSGVYAWYVLIPKSLGLDYTKLAMETRDSGIVSLDITGTVVMDTPKSTIIAFPFA